jgi:sigma-B regulation protein RsbU (phosphoserine phosphatase)
VSAPVVYQYQQALDEFRREGRELPLLKRMSELVSLLDLTTTLGSGLGPDEILEAALLIVMGELQVARGALYVAAEDGGFDLRVGRGLPAEVPRRLEARPPGGSADVEEITAPALCGAGLKVVCPVRRGARTLALLALGPRVDGRPLGREETGFLGSLSACAAVPIENGLIYEELRQANRSLSLKVFQLHSLFDLGRELTASLDEDAIERLVATTLVGHFLATRCALFRLEPSGLVITQWRGLRPEEATLAVPCDPRTLERDLPGPRKVTDLAPGPLREALSKLRFVLAVPLAAADRPSGLLAVGERASGQGYADEDLEFAGALARQTQAAVEGARLHRVRLEKERQDRDLQIARGIQQTLLPSGPPEVPGFQIVAESRSCYEVGGDYYDFLPLENGRLAMVIADVSGKGTPASIMMASVHASLQALAGTAPPARLLERLNRFLYAKTQASRYVTLFYCELDPVRRSLEYVNAGHVPPFLRRADGSLERLTAGGPVLGLLEEVALDAGQVTMAPGDMLAAVTDGVTEAMDPAGDELGEARAVRALAATDGGARAALGALVEAVDEWTGGAGCSDDLTVLILRAT